MPAGPVSKEALAEQYKTASNLDARISLNERFSTNPYSGMRWRFDHFDLPSEAAILELGCGTGNLWQQNADRIPPGWRITLSDLSAGMLDKARQNTAQVNARLDFAVADITVIPFADESFEAVIANHMLYYVTDRSLRARSLAVIRRVLKPGGRFYATTNGMNHMRELVALVNQFDASLPFVTQVVQNFSLESGPAEAAEWLNDVAVRRFDDALVVNDAEPLIAYILSSSTILGLPAARKQALGEFIRQWMADHGGAIRIQKDTGLISARRI